MTDESGLSIAGAIAALLGAIVIAAITYFIIGFPANVPVGLGAAVVLVEVLEGYRRAAEMRTVAITAAFHGALAACAAWLGVVLVRVAGWMG